MTAPQRNVDVFRHKPVQEVSALVPTERADWVYKDLDNAGYDLSQVQVLQGEEGARILDKRGAEHGYCARLVRVLQRLGIDENVLDVYDEALRDGESLITVPCVHGSRRELAYLLEPHGAHGVIYWGKGTRELLSAL